MTTDEAAGRMVHTPTEAPRVLEAPGVTRLRVLLAERTAERDELLGILRDVVCRAPDGVIEVAYIEGIDLCEVQPSLAKWIPAR